MPRNLNPLPARQITVNRLPKLIDARFQRLDLCRQINGLVFLGERPHLIELSLELKNRSLEVEQVLVVWLGHKRCNQVQIRRWVVNTTAEIGLQVRYSGERVGNKTGCYVRLRLFRKIPQSIAEL